MCSSALIESSEEIECEGDSLSIDILKLVDRDDSN